MTQQLQRTGGKPKVVMERWYSQSLRSQSLRFRLTLFIICKVERPRTRFENGGCLSVKGDNLAFFALCRVGVGSLLFIGDAPGRFRLTRRSVDVLPLHLCQFQTSCWQQKPPWSVHVPPRECTPALEFGQRIPPPTNRRLRLCVCSARLYVLIKCVVWRLAR